jgi:hypothetical protein
MLILLYLLLLLLLLHDFIIRVAYSSVVCIAQFSQCKIVNLAARAYVYSLTRRCYSDQLLAILLILLLEEFLRRLSRFGQAKR